VAVALSPDGKKLAHARFPDMRKEQGIVVFLLDVATGRVVWEIRSELLRALGGCHRPDLAMAFAPDGKTLAAWGDADQAIHLWDVTSGGEFHALEVVSRPIDHAVFCSGGRTLATVSPGEDFVRLWDVTTGRELRRLRGHLGRVDCLAVSADGTALATSSHGEQVIRLWEAATGRETGQLAGHGSRTGIIDRKPIDAIVFAPGAKELISTGQDDKVRVWDLAARKQLRQVSAAEVCLSPDGKSAFAPTGTWDLVTGTRRSSSWRPTSGDAVIGFTPDSRALICRGKNGLIEVRDVTTGTLVRSIPGQTDSCVCLSVDGTLLAEGAADGRVRLWDLTTGKERSRVRTGQGRITALAFSADGRRLASAGGDTTLLIWDVATLAVTGRAP
jgi:WD40 repeat protein